MFSLTIVICLSGKGRGDTMKPTEWIAILFLLFFFFTSTSNVHAADDNGVMHRVALEAAVMTLIN